MIPGEEGWPNGTMYRWHRLLENMPDTEYVFLCDADMRFESMVSHEIISDCVTVTLHPGYVGKNNMSCRMRDGSNLLVVCLADHNISVAGSLVAQPKSLNVSQTGSVPTLI